MLGREGDGLTQPITSYFRVLNVNVPALIADCEANRDDMWEVVYPKEAGDRNEDYVMAVLLTGFQQRIKDKVAEGFDWIIPKDHITMKTGLIPGEISVNVTRFQGNGLDDRDLSRAEIEIRKQAYCAFDFLQRYVEGLRDRHLPRGRAETRHSRDAPRHRAICADRGRRARQPPLRRCDRAVQLAGRRA